MGQTLKPDNFRGPKAFIVRHAGASFQVFDPNDGTVRSDGHATEEAAYEWIGRSAEAYHAKRRRDKARAALKPWERSAWDLSTSHVTKDDAGKLDVGTGPVRVANHEHGWILFIPCGLGADDASDLIKTMRAEGWSDAIIAIVGAAIAAEVSLVNFDQGSDAHEEWPTFDW